jgi:hypothetical protein
MPIYITLKTCLWRERESLAGESQLAEQRKQKKQGGREDLKPESIQRTARRKSEQF